MLVFGGLSAGFFPFNCRCFSGCYCWPQGLVLTLALMIHRADWRTSASFTALTCGSRRHFLSCGHVWGHPSRSRCCSIFCRRKKAEYWRSGRVAPLVITNQLQMFSLCSCSSLIVMQLRLSFGPFAAVVSHVIYSCPKLSFKKKI